MAKEDPSEVFAIVSKIQSEELKNDD